MPYVLLLEDEKGCLKGNPGILEDSGWFKKNKKKLVLFVLFLLFAAGL